MNAKRMARQGRVRDKKSAPDRIALTLDDIADALEAIDGRLCEIAAAKVQKP